MNQLQGGAATSSAYTGAYVVGRQHEDGYGVIRTVAAITPCATMPDNTQTSIVYYSPTLWERLTGKYKKTDYVRQSTDAPNC
ncbi:hypothetical protein LJC16_00040 [Bacteroidales bacterium OttesenSCG-928-C19]|nr:hypothetical protein [Bacteroidales bacterium OttesenSCG-928-C19]